PETAPPLGSVIRSPESRLFEPRTGRGGSPGYRSVCEDQRCAADQRVTAKQLVRFLGAVEREGPADNRADASLAQELERLRDLGQGDVARAVDLEHRAEHVARVDQEARVDAEGGRGPAADDHQAARARQ